MQVWEHIREDMKRALVIAVALALPLLGEEPKQQTPAPQVAQPDSPLVAAAKRANRKGKKPAYVITNETLKQSGAGAHVTTTAAQRAIQLPPYLPPPTPTPEMAAIQERDRQKRAAAAQAAQVKKAEEEQTRKAEQAAAAAEDGYDGTQDDASELVPATPPPGL